MAISAFHALSMLISIGIQTEISKFYMLEEHALRLCTDNVAICYPTLCVAARDRNGFLEAQGIYLLVSVPTLAIQNYYEDEDTTLFLMAPEMLILLSKSFACVRFKDAFYGSEDFSRRKKPYLWRMMRQDLSAAKNVTWRIAILLLEKKDCEPERSLLIACLGAIDSFLRFQNIAADAKRSEPLENWSHSVRK